MRHDKVTCWSSAALWQTETMQSQGCCRASGLPRERGAGYSSRAFTSCPPDHTTQLCNSKLAGMHKTLNTAQHGMMNPCCTAWRFVYGNTSALQVSCLNCQWQGKARQGKARPGKAGKARQGKARQGKARHQRAGLSKAQHDTLVSLSQSQPVTACSHDSTKHVHTTNTDKSICM